MSSSPQAIVILTHPTPPVETAAQEVATRLAIPVRNAESPDPANLNIGSLDFARCHAGFAAWLAETPDGDKWHAIYQHDEGGWTVAAPTPRETAHAALTLADWLEWNEPLPKPFRVVRRRAITHFENEFDDWSGGFHRMADDFDMERHIAEAARLGLETFEVNLLADTVPVQVRERRHWRDFYQWWSVYSPALDMFVESSLNRGTYHPDMLARNLAKLRETAEIARRWGLKPTFTAFEPRAWPERLFDRYPDLRGARVDCSDYSVEAEYAPDPNHPWVLDHYTEMMTNLMREVPDLHGFSIWSQDSCAGFPWAEVLYPGANGPRPPRKFPIEETVARFSRTLLEAGRAVNPNLRVTVCLHWFRPGERDRIAPALPEGVGMTHTVRVLPATDVEDVAGRTEPWEGYDRWAGAVAPGESGAQLEHVANPWKPYGPLFGVAFPWLAFDALRNAREVGGIDRLILRGGYQSPVFVPHYINNEVMRTFLYEGSDLDIDALVARRAQAWTESPKEAEALIEAWRLADQSARRHNPHAWTVDFVSGRTLWRRLVRPIVPDQTLLDDEDTRHYRHLEFNVGLSDPAWIDNFYKGWGSMLADDKARAAVEQYDQRVLPPLEQAVAVLDAAGPLSPTARDARDRIAALRHMLRTDRNLIAAQEAIHAALEDKPDAPADSPHTQRLRDAMADEIENAEGLRDLCNATESTLFAVTSGEETTYLIKAPFSHQMTRKLKAMRRHLDDAPGPQHGQFLPRGVIGG